MAWIHRKEDLLYKYTKSGNLETSIQNPYFCCDGELENVEMMKRFQLLQAQIFTKFPVSMYTSGTTNEDGTL